VTQLDKYMLPTLPFYTSVWYTTSFLTCPLASFCVGMFYSYSRSSWPVFYCYSWDCWLSYSCVAVLHTRLDTLLSIVLYHHTDLITYSKLQLRKIE